MYIFNKLLWVFTSLFIIILSIYFSYNLNFPQLKLKKIIRSINLSSNNKNSPLMSLMLSLSSKIGVGSISGICIALKTGGIGSIFWIWIITIIISSISYIESYYGEKYKVQTSKDTYVGGPHYYLKNVLVKRNLSLIYAYLLIICYGIGFISIQTNTLSIVADMTISIDKNIINGLITFLIIYCLYTNIDKKNKILSRLVPIMTVLYLIFGLIVLFNNLSLVYLVLVSIIKSAFNFKSFFSSLIYPIIIGMQRAIFSTEVGIGTAAISASISDYKELNPGYVQILSNYITTFIFSTITAIIILTSNYEIYMNNTSNGIELAYFAFKYHFNSIGGLFIFISIFFFAFSTIISGFYYGENALKFLTNNKFILSFYKIFVIISIFFSMYTNSSSLWNLIDILIAILCLINLYALIKLYKSKEKRL